MVIAVVIALAIIALTAAAWYLTRRPPPPLDAFALAATAAVTGMLWWPAQFHYHFAAFLAPFLAAAIALPAARCASALAATGPAAAQWLPLGVPFLAAALLALFAVIQVGTEGGLRPYISPAAITATSKAIPRGSCVVSDEVSYLLMANRFSSDVAGCSQLVDGLGTDLALSGGLTPATGAGRVRAVAATWRSAFSHASYALLSVWNARRVAWTPALRAYFRAHFALAARDARGDALYARTRLAVADAGYTRFLTVTESLDADRNAAARRHCHRHPYLMRGLKCVRGTQLPGVVRHYLRTVAN